MWSDVVTIYREDSGKVERHVANNCCFEMKMELSEDLLGNGQKEKCFLAAPAGVKIRPGDLVVAGIGPNDAPENAARIRVVKPWYLHGRLHHTQAEGSR